MVPLALNNRGTGSKLVTRSGVFEIPVAEWLEHSFSVGFTYAFITSPLQVLYMRRSGNAYHRALQTSWRGWADSKAVHSMECIGARSRYWRTLSQEGLLPAVRCTASAGRCTTQPRTRTISQRTKTTDWPQVLCPGGIYSWWHSASPANGNGSHDSAPVSWAYHILCPTMVSPNAN